MNKYFAASEALKRQAQKYEQLIEASKALAEIGSLEQAADESRASAEQASVEAKEAKTELVKVKDQIKKATIDANTKSAAALEATTAELAKLTKDAEMSAAEILKKAQDEAAQLVAQAATEKARMSSELGGLQKSILDLQTELSSLLKAREAAIKSANDAEAKLEGIRGKLKVLAGL